MSAEADPPPAMKRARVRKPLRTGVRVIDLFAPICAGQRVGIFAGSGVGKSTLLAMLAHSQGFDTVVLALVGERGREVREFIEDVLASERARHHRRIDRRRKPDDAAAGAEDRHGGRRIFSRPRRIGAADRRFDHPIRPCRA